MRIRTSFLTACGLFFAACSLPAATIYTANLIGANEVPPSGSPGVGNATLSLSGDMLSIAISFSGLTSFDTMSHIHCCGALGTNAPVALGFTTFPTGFTAATFSFTYDLTSAAVYTTAFLSASGGTAAGAEAALINGFNTGQTYVNIHTLNFPSGEIRGQVAAATPEPSSLLLSAGAFLLFLARRRPSRYPAIP